MTVPKYNELYLPLLEVLAEGKPYGLPDVASAIAQKLSLSAADLAETIPSGYSKFLNRLGWARSDLGKAGLIEPVSRGVYRITDFGLANLPTLPPVFDRAFLTQKRWGQWANTEKTLPQENANTLGSSEETPDEQIERAFDEMEDALASELLDRLKKLLPASFERFVVELLKAMGYGIGEVTGRTGDGGIDGVIYEDRLRLDRIYLQAKRWADQPVGAPEIQGFIGALASHGATRGVFVTTSRYTTAAVNAANVPHLRIKLVGGTELAKLAIEYNVGVSTKRRFEIKRLDSDYFDEIGGF